MCHPGTGYTYLVPRRPLQGGISSESLERIKYPGICTESCLFLTHPFSFIETVRRVGSFHCRECWEGYRKMNQRALPLLPVALPFFLELSLTHIYPPSSPMPNEVYCEPSACSYIVRLNLSERGFLLQPQEQGQFIIIQRKQNTVGFYYNFSVVLFLKPWIHFFLLPGRRGCCLGLFLEFPSSVLVCFL